RARYDLGKVVARADGDDAKRDIRGPAVLGFEQQTVCHVVNGAIAACGYDRLHALTHRLTSERHGVPGVFGFHHVSTNTTRAERVFDQGAHLPATATPRHRVQDHPHAEPSDPAASVASAMGRLAAAVMVWSTSSATVSGPIEPCG